jgi:hypothetical protein
MRTGKQQRRPFFCCELLPSGQSARKAEAEAEAAAEAEVEPEAEAAAEEDAPEADGRACILQLRRRVAALEPEGEDVLLERAGGRAAPLRQLRVVPAHEQ